MDGMGDNKGQNIIPTMLNRITLAKAMSECTTDDSPNDHSLDANGLPHHTNINELGVMRKIVNALGRIKPWAGAEANGISESNYCDYMDLHLVQVKVLSLACENERGVKTDLGKVHPNANTVGSQLGKGSLKRSQNKAGFGNIASPVGKSPATTVPCTGKGHSEEKEEHKERREVQVARRQVVCAEEKNKKELDGWKQDIQSGGKGCSEEKEDHRERREVKYARKQMGCAEEKNEMDEDGWKEDDQPRDELDRFVSVFGTDVAAIVGGDASRNKTKATRCMTSLTKPSQNVPKKKKKKATVRFQSKN